MPPISETGKKERRRAVGSTIGTMAMSGLKTDDVTRAILNMYAEGHLSLVEMERAIDVLVHSYLRDPPPVNPLNIVHNYIIDNRPTERYEINGCVRWRTIPDKENERAFSS